MISVKSNADKTVVIKDGTVGIARGAFAGTKDVIRVDIPASVKYIGGMAFSGSSIKEIFFADTQGWMIEKEAIPSDALGDMKKASEYLLKTYNAQTWTKNG